MGKEWDRLGGEHWRTDRSPDKTGRGSWFGDNHNSPRYGGEPHRQQEWHQAWATEALRVLKPGGHLLAFGGTRTYHRLVCAVEDAGFEIRDTISWLYGSGFPKSLDVSKAIDRAAPRAGMFDAFATHFAECRAAKGLGQKDIATHFPSKTGGLTGCVWNWENGANVPTVAQWRVLQPMLDMANEWLPLIERVEAEREVVGDNPYNAVRGQSTGTHTIVPAQAPSQITAPATPEAERWQGWGTALAPAHEPIVVARKPLSGTVAATVLEWGTGAINIDASRVNSGQSPSRMGGCPSNGSAPHVAQLSGWHPVALPEAKAPIALALAATQPEGDPVLLIRIGEAEDSYGRMAMSPSATKAITNSSIGSSWKPNSVGGSDQPSTSITETATGLTTDPRILSFCQSAHTLLSTTRAVTPPGGCKCDAWPVVESSNGGGWKWSAIPLRIAPALASAPLGRWPKNCVLSHTEGCVQVGTRKVKRNSPMGRETDGIGYHGVPSDSTTSRDEMVGAWSCTPGCPVRLLDEQTGELQSGSREAGEYGRLGYQGWDAGPMPAINGDRGGASRFFYVAKASRGERNAGLEGFEEQNHVSLDTRNGYLSDPRMERQQERRPTRNGHPTVKPISLMRWLVRLVTPPGGTVLDPFAGSGTTGCACALEAFDFIGLEREPEYVKIAEARIAWWHKHRGDGEAAEILAAGAARDEVEATGQLGMFDEPEPVDRTNREGEASAERRYTNRGGSNFAMKPGRRRR